MFVKSALKLRKFRYTTRNNRLLDIVNNSNDTENAIRDMINNTMHQKVTEDIRDLYNRVDEAKLFNTLKIIMTNGIYMDSTVISLDIAQKLLNDKHIDHLDKNISNMIDCIVRRRISQIGPYATSNDFYTNACYQNDAPLCLNKFIELKYADIGKIFSNICKLTSFNYIKRHQFIRKINNKELTKLYYKNSAMKLLIAKILAAVVLFIYSKYYST